MASRRGQLGHADIVMRVWRVCGLAVAGECGFQINKLVGYLLCIDEVHVLVQLGANGIDTIDVKFWFGFEGYKH